MSKAHKIYNKSLTNFIINIAIIILFIVVVISILLYHMYISDLVLSEVSEAL